MRSQNTPLFSVIIPTYNRKKFLEIAIESVFSQEFSDFELIVIDDGSDDGSKELCQDYQDPRLYYSYQNNQGVAYARNRGLEQAKGAFIAFLDSDDRWVPEKLERVRQCIKEYPKIHIFHTEEVWYRRGKILNPKKVHKKPDGWVYEQALPLCCISISTAVVQRDVFEKVGNFDETFAICEDYDFWLRATHRYEVKLIPEYLTLKDGGRPDQLTSNVWGLDQYRIRALEKMLCSGVLNAEDYKKTFQELERKATIFSQGAEKRGRSQEAAFYYGMIERYHPSTAQ